MKTRMLTTLAMCAMVCSVAMASAQEADDLIESATPSAPKETAPYDLLNPQRGMTFSVYGSNEWNLPRENNKKLAHIRESLSTLPKAAAAKTSIDNGDKFSIDCAKGIDVSAIRWEGYLKCKQTTICTFAVKRVYCRRGDELCAGYVIRVNNVIRAGFGENSFDVELKAGFNKVELVCVYLEGTYCSNCGRVIKEPLNLSIKPKGSLAEAKTLSPSIFWHDEKPIPSAADIIE